MSAGSKDKVFAFDPRDLRQTQPRLNRHQDKRVIASSEPGVAVGGGEQSIDFQTREEADERARKALAGDGQNTLDLRRVGRQLEGGVAKERMNSSQPQVAAAHTQALMLLEVIEKRHDQGCVDLIRTSALMGTCAAADG